MQRRDKSDVDAWRAELDRAERVLGRIGPDDICCEGLTPRQASILRILTAREGARLSDLAAAAEITPSAMTRVLEKLERRNLVQRVRGAGDDGRAAIVEITSEGRRVRGRIDEMVCDRSKAIMTAIPEPQREQVLAALRLFNDALENAGCCGPNYCCDTSDGSIVNIDADAAGVERPNSSLHRTSGGNSSTNVTERQRRDTRSKS